MYISFIIVRYIAVSVTRTVVVRTASVQHRHVGHLAGSFLIFYEARHRHSAAVSCRFGPCEKQLNVAEFIFGSLNLIPVLLRESR